MESTEVLVPENPPTWLVVLFVGVITWGIVDSLTFRKFVTALEDKDFPRAERWLRIHGVVRLPEGMQPDARAD